MAKKKNRKKKTAPAAPTEAEAVASQQTVEPQESPALSQREKDIAAGQKAAAEKQAAEAEAQRKAAEEKLKADQERAAAEKRKAEYERSPEGVAKKNVSGIIDRQKSFLSATEGYESMGRDELRKMAAGGGDFSKQYGSVLDDASKFSIKERFGQKVGYVKAAAKDHAFNLFGGGSAERMADTRHYRNEYKAGIQERIDQRVDNKIREQVGQSREMVGNSMKNHEQLLSNIEKKNPLAIMAGQTNKGITEYTGAIKKDAERKATAQAEKAAEKSASKGFGWKGKVGAVAGLLALGGVIGSQFAGGRKSNAELYNPNPQPQYYS